jgi:hypothetical protein
VISMNTTLAIPALVLSIVPMVIVTPASAQTTQVRSPISFTLTPACPNLQVTVVGTGDSFTVTNHRIDAAGVDHIQINNLVTGTATDSEGATYRFNYHNHATLEVPASGFPFSVTTTDHFNLVGKGKANQVHIGFVVRLTITGPSDSPIVERLVNMRGEAFLCDPI